MPDLTLLTYPALALISALVISVLVGENVVIDKISVPSKLTASGFGTDVATRQFVDALREVNSVAASEVTDLQVDPSDRQEGLGAFEAYFSVTVLINGARDVLGLVPFYIEGEITEGKGEDVMTVRVFTNDITKPVYVSVTEGDPNDLRPMVKQAAVNVLERLSPYVAALYYRQTELGADQFDFPKTQAAADRFLASQPPEKHYLIYGLLGRMHMIKAEQDKALTPDQKQSEYDEAMKYLNAAILQNGGFLFPYLNIGLIQEARGHYDLAEQYYARAVEINPNYLLTREAWGDLLVKEGRFEDAAFQYVAAVEINRRSAELRDKLAHIYLALGRPEAARAQWAEALRISPLTSAYASAIRGVDEGHPTAAIGAECHPGGATPC